MGVNGEAQTLGGLAQTQEQKNEALTLVEHPGLLIFVRTKAGKNKYKELGNVLDTDSIHLKKDGTPYTRKKAKKRGSRPTAEEIEEKCDRKSDMIKNDPLVAISRRDPTSPEVLKHVMTALAEEGASIGFERQEAERQGKETSRLSIRRTTIYKTYVEAYLKHQEIKSIRQDDAIDIDSPVFQKVFHLIVRTFGEAMDDASIDPRMSEIVLAKFIKSVSSDDWHARVKLAMKQAL